MCKTQSFGFCSEYFPYLASSRLDQTSHEQELGFKFIPCFRSLEADADWMLQESCTKVQVPLNPFHYTRSANREKSELKNHLALLSKSLMTFFKFSLPGICCALLTFQLPVWILHSRKNICVVGPQIYLQFCTP